MNDRPAGAATGSLSFLVVGTVLLLISVAFDPLRGRPLDFGLQQSVVAFIALLCLAEGTLQARGRGFPAVWSTLTSEGATGVALTYGLAFALSGLLLYQFRAYAADDAYITFRYAHNLAHGAGVAWNPGEPPVEGYSNFLWMLLTAAGLRLGLDPLMVARGAAVLCYAGSLVLVRALALRAGASARHANLPVILLAAIPAFAYWTVSGLETMSVVFLSLLYFLALAREAAPDALPWRSALVADLLLLSRPDTPLLIGLAVVPLLWPFTRERRVWLGRLALLALPIAALYLGWKWVTFHRLFANTVSAKLHLLAGLQLVTGFFAFAFPLLVVLVAALPRGARTLERQVLLVVLGYFAALLNAASQVGHYYRFFLPVLAPMLAAAALAADRWTASAGPSLRRAPALLFLMTMLYTLSPLLPMVGYANGEARGLQRAHVEVARLLRKNFTPGQLLAASDCGVLPYISQMRTLDIWGLTDRTIAEKGFDADYVMRAAPDVLVLHSLQPGRFAGRDVYDRQLQERVAADPAYHLAGEWEFFGYWLWVYSKKELVPV
jgi:hypothetical protein